MKPIHFAAILVVLVGCGGSGQQSASKSGYDEPTIKFVDLSLGPQIPRSRGLEFTLNCGLRIRNPNSFPIHARQLRVSLNGTVRLEMDQTSRVLDADIPGGTSRVVPVDFTAFTQEETVHLFPLSITGRVFFDSPKGSFTVAVVRSFNPETEETSSDDDPDAVD